MPCQPGTSKVLLEQVIGDPVVDQILSVERPDYDTLNLVNQWSFLCEVRQQFEDAAKLKILQIRLHELLLNGSAHPIDIAANDTVSKVRDSDFFPHRSNRHSETVD